MNVAYFHHKDTGSEPAHNSVAVCAFLFQFKLGALFGIYVVGYSDKADHFSLVAEHTDFRELPPVIFPVLFVVQTELLDSLAGTSFIVQTFYFLYVVRMNRTFKRIVNPIIFARFYEINTVIGQIAHAEHGFVLKINVHGDSVRGFKYLIYFCTRTVNQLFVFQKLRYVVERNADYRVFFCSAKLSVNTVQRDNLSVPVIAVYNRADCLICIQRFDAGIAGNLRVLRRHHFPDIDGFFADVFGRITDNSLISLVYANYLKLSVIHFINAETAKSSAYQLRYKRAASE